MMARATLDDWTPTQIGSFRDAITERNVGLMAPDSLGALRAIERRDEKITQLNGALERANVLIGEAADEAKRLSDTIDRQRADLERCKAPCPNHRHVVGLPFEACPICVNST